MRGQAVLSKFLFISGVRSQNDVQEDLANRVEQFVQGTAYNIDECGDIHRQATPTQMSWIKR